MHAYEYMYVCEGKSMMKRKAKQAHRSIISRQMVSKYHLMLLNNPRALCVMRMACACGCVRVMREACGEELQNKPCAALFLSVGVQVPPKGR